MTVADKRIDDSAANSDAGPKAKPAGPPSSIEDLVAMAWEAALKRKSIDRDADFRNLKMNSNRSMEVIRYIWKKTSIELPVNIFFDSPTIRQMAKAITDGNALVAPDLVRLRDGDGSTPLFLFPGGGGALVELTDLVRELDEPGVIYGIPFSGLDGIEPFYDRFEAEAARSLRVMRQVQHSGPYRLIGYSIGGITALETARLLRKEGDDPMFLGLIDTPQNDHSWPLRVWLAFMLRKILRKGSKILRKVRLPQRARRSSGGPSLSRVDINPRRRGTPLEYRFRNPNNPHYPYYSPYWVAYHTPKYSRVAENACRMKGFYTPSHYDGKAFVFASIGGDPAVCDPEQVWPKYLPNAKWIRVPGNHLSMLIGRNAVRLAGEISECLKQVAPADSALRHRAAHCPAIAGPVGSAALRDDKTKRGIIMPDTATSSASRL
jgi:thioesterase domain-containing protein